MGKVETKRLKALRKSRNLIQEDVANAIGIGRTGYVRIENGERDADTNTLSKLADYFNVSVDYLLGRTNDPHQLLLGNGLTIPEEERKALQQYSDNQQAIQDEYVEKAKALFAQMDEEHKKAAIAQLEALAALGRK